MVKGTEALAEVSLVLLGFLPIVVAPQARMSWPKFLSPNLYDQLLERAEAR